MIIRAFNDMLGKGWDSAAQYSFCIQESLKGNPQFWWVRETLRKFPHPPEWEHVSRGPDGKYKHFPGGKKSSLSLGLKRFADILLEKGYKEEAEQIFKIAGYEDLLKEIERVEDLLRKGTLNRLTLILIGKSRLAECFDKILGTTTEVYKQIIGNRLLEMIKLLQGVKQGKDAEFTEAADEVLRSLQEVKNKYDI